MKTAKFLTLVFVIAIFSACSQLNAESIETSQWRGPNRDGKFPDKGLLKEWPENGPKLAWKFDKLGKGFSSPAFTSDKFYLTGMHDTIGYAYCFSHSGELLWEKAYGPEWTRNFPGTRANITIHGDKAYLMTTWGVIHCLNAANGETVWTVDLMKDYGAPQIIFGLTEVLLIDGEKLFVTPGGEEHNVIALNRNTGELIWTSKGNGKPSVYGTPIIHEHNGERFLSVYSKNNLMAIHPENGEIFWMHPMNYDGGIHANSTIYKDGKIFTLNGWGKYSYMFEISEDGRSVKEVWKNELMDLENGDAILMGDKLYGSNWKHKGISCVDWNTGKELYTTKDLFSGTLIWADDMFYFFGAKGQVALVKDHGNAFEVVSSFQLDPKKSRDHSAHPVIHDQKLFIRYDTTLYVYDIAK